MSMHMSSEKRKDFVNDLKKAREMIIIEIGNRKEEYSVTFLGKKYTFVPDEDNHWLRKEYADALIQNALKNLADDITHACSARCYDNEESPCMRNNPWHEIDNELEMGVRTRRSPLVKKPKYVISAMHPWK